MLSGGMLGCGMVFGIRMGKVGRGGVRIRSHGFGERESALLG
jgi:hypothetical protein